MAKSETTTISIRVSKSEKERLDRLSNDTGILLSSLAKMCLLSACDYYEKKGMLTLPLRFQPLSPDEQEAYRATYGKDPESLTKRHAG